MKRSAWISLLVCVLVGGMIAAAQAQPDENQRRTRIDVGGFYYNFFEGGDAYGPWWGGHFRAINSPAPGQLGFTGLFEIVAERRDDTGNEADGFYFVSGGYYDLHPDLYSYTSVGLGTNEPFAQFTVHQELNYKLPPNRDVVFGFGGGYVDYIGVNEAGYLSVGTAYYWADTFNDESTSIVQYQYRRYFASPVDEQLNTHILSVGFGWQQRSWTRLRYVNGRELFRAGGGTAALFDADLDGQVLTLEHEHTITDMFGVVVAFDFRKKSRRVDDVTLFSGTGFELRFFWNL